MSSHGPGSGTLTPEAFIAKWDASTRNEQAASKEHFLDLCALLDVPTPNSDATGASYAFEKGAAKAGAKTGWADVWRRGCFGWEYKSRGGDLDAAHVQLLRYAGALENPPLLITCDMARLVVRTNWTKLISVRHEFALADLRDPTIRARLRAIWLDPDLWLPGTTREALTAKAATEFAGLAMRLQDRGHPPQSVAHFVIRLAFCLFADDVKLLPPGLFEKMLSHAARRPAAFSELAGELFRAMRSPGGRVGYDAIPWFNGGLFDDDDALPLEKQDIESLQAVAALDWADIDPSIIGTLFERGLDPAKRSQLGAHYTSREMIERLIDPVIRRPLRAEWDAARAVIADAMARRAEKLATPKDAASVALELLGAAEHVSAATRKARADAAKQAKARRDAAEAEQAKAEAALGGFLARLRGFRVLDPACGSGNFLYLSLLALKDLERVAILDAEALGLPPRFPEVGPEAVLGIEISPYAAELARVSVWIGHIQWARANGYPVPENPVLRALDNIACRDALLEEDGTVAVWPAADVIVGNPPFLGDKAMIGGLGADYVKRLRAAYDGRVPGGADLVCYWFDKARAQLGADQAQRAGLVATNSIRGGANRRVLDRIVESGEIFEAWSDEPWTLDGAAVRVSLVAFAKTGDRNGFLDGNSVTLINADLTADVADLTTASVLAENTGVAYIGIQKTGLFEIEGEMARAWLIEPLNPNGYSNSQVVRPWWNGLDITRRPRDFWIVDFDSEQNESKAAYFSSPYSWLSKYVRPTRVGKREERTNRCWWLFQWSRPTMRLALAQCSRFIITPRVSKHRIFAWLPTTTLPDSATTAIARDDDTSFGILHSRFHEAWSLRLGTFLGVGNDPRYTPSTTFETFPFPENLTPNLPAASYADNPLAQAIAAAAVDLVAKRDLWLNPPDLVDRVPEVVAGFPDRIIAKNPVAAATLKTRTLTNLYNTRGSPAGAWLDALHARLDAAVAAAYGWQADISTDDALAALLALNHARAG